jgi:ribosomal protein S18 acetylase RimI-like enzyme
MLASWQEYASGAVGAVLQRLPGVAGAVFPNEPERAFYNNAVLGKGLAAAERADAIDGMEAAYAGAGVTRFAAWVHESDIAMQDELERRGYAVAESTLAMGMSLDDLGMPRPRIELGSTDWSEYVRLLGVPPGFLAGADAAAFHVVVARRDGENVATAMAFDHAGDCGIYNVTTLEHARRRGLGTALTALLLHDAIERGCRTATLQSTPIAEGVYRTVGFRGLGRILEYGPPQGSQRSGTSTTRKPSGS